MAYVTTPKPRPAVNGVERTTGCGRDRYARPALAAVGARMELARIGVRGQTTIPKCVRVAAGLKAGDTLAFELAADHLVVRKMPPAQDAYLHGLAHTLDEWNSPQDEDAWRDL